MYVHLFIFFERLQSVLFLVDGSRNILVNNQKERGWAIGDAKGHVLFAWMWGSNYDENMFGFSKTVPYIYIFQNINLQIFNLDEQGDWR